MRVGTKSILFGVHQPIVHAGFMFAAWVKLYGWSRELLDPRLHLCFLLHDIGYWGCKSMDGPDGELHPISGANIVRKLFGKKWGDMCLFHSGTMVKKTNKALNVFPETKKVSPSKMYAPDKLASAIYPTWLYKILSCLSGEWKEYAAIQWGGKQEASHYYYEELDVVYIRVDKEIKTVVFEEWWNTARDRMSNRAFEHAKSGNWMTMQEAIKHGGKGRNEQ